MTLDELERVIRRACERAAATLVDGPDRANPGKINDWEPDALASWIAPTVNRAVRRHLNAPAKKRKRT